MTYYVRHSILYHVRRSTTDVATTDNTTTDSTSGGTMTTISSDVIRGYNDTMILYLLQKKPSYGYELSKDIKALSEEKYVIKETTLYSAFTRMEDNGYVESYSQEAENGKRRTYYRITDKGRSYYKEKCEEWNLTKEVVEKFINKDEN